MVAGLGTITPAAGSVGPGGALLIGLAAGVVCFNATHYLKRVLSVDDSLDVFPVHGIGGILGTLAAGIFASNALGVFRSEEHTSELQSLMRNSYAVFCLKKKNNTISAE